MSDEPKIRAKRGRPSKNPEKRPKTGSESQEPVGNTEYETKVDRPKSQNKFLDLYYELHCNFIREGISQQSQHLLRKITSSPVVPESFRGSSLLITLNLITQEFFMNELEIVVLSIYLEKFAWPDTSRDSEFLVRQTAYAVKHNLSEDIQAINAYISFKYPKFLEDFQPWYESYKHLMTVNPRDLNDKFKELSKAAALPGDAKIMDYNSYVDEILQYTPHMLYDKPQLEEMMADQGCLELLSAIRNKKKIVNKEGEEVQAAVLIKLETLMVEVASVVKEEPEGVYSVSAALMQKVEAFISGELDEAEKEEE